MTENFQDGCNSIVNKLTELGVTPASNSPSDIITAIQTLKNKNNFNGQSYRLTYDTHAGDGYTTGGIATGYVDLNVNNKGDISIVTTSGGKGKFNISKKTSSGSFSTINFNAYKI